jgi:hypothetical protein
MHTIGMTHFTLLPYLDLILHHDDPGSEANLTQQSVSIQSERVKPG